MRKPANDDFEYFTDVFESHSKKVGKKQYLIPYFIASHPGSDLDAMINLAVFLKRNGYNQIKYRTSFLLHWMSPRRCTTPALIPLRRKPVHIAKGLRDRKMQRALMQFFKLKNYFEVREALRQAGRTDLIGDDCDSLIPSTPPKEALMRRRQDANARFSGEYVHKIGGKTAGKGPGKCGNNKERRERTTKGYRPGRKGAKDKE